MTIFLRHAGECPVTKCVHNRGKRGLSCGFGMDVVLVCLHPRHKVAFHELVILDREASAVDVEAAVDTEAAAVDVEAGAVTLRGMTARAAVASRTAEVMLPAEAASRAQQLALQLEVT